MVAARARRYLPRTGKDAFTERRAALGVCRRMRTKRELEFWMAVREHCVPAAYGTLHLVWGASVAFEYIQ